jgi:hypothetical protein
MNEDSKVAVSANDAVHRAYQSFREDRALQSFSDEMQRARAIERLLPAVAPGMTVDEILVGWQTEPKPDKRTLAGLLKIGAEHGRWRFTGTGKKNDPFRYWFAAY